MLATIQEYEKNTMHYYYFNIDPINIVKNLKSVHMWLLYSHYLFHFRLLNVQNVYFVEF